MVATILLIDWRLNKKKNHDLGDGLDILCKLDNTLQ